MNLRKTMLLALALMWSFSAYAQQPSQPLTFRSEYAVKAGKEEEFLNLVKAVGQPVRDKLMAEGVVLAWGVESPLLRGHDSATHTIWYVVADWSGVEKAQSGIAAQIAKLDAESGKASEEARKKGAKPAVSTMDRLRDAVEFDLTKDYATRDIVFVAGQSMPPAGTLPYTRSNFVKVKPGKADAYRATWEKYNKPVLDKLVADGTVLAFGLAVEDVKTTDDFTHFVWYAVNNLGGLETVRNAYLADRARRSQEERDAITAAFLSVTEPDASRSEVNRSLIFHLPGQK